MENKELLEKVSKRIEEAVEKISNASLSSQNIELLHYLIKTEKEICEMKKGHVSGRTKGGDRINGMFGEIAERWTEYTDSKERYRDSHDDMDRRRMVNSLRMMLVRLNDMVQELIGWSECTEEREVIENYRSGIL